LSRYRAILFGTREAPDFSMNFLLTIICRFFRVSGLLYQRNNKHAESFLINKTPLLYQFSGAFCKEQEVNMENSYYVR
ncbi:MAG: hypothetical protein PHG45_04805, partial [Dehalococcoidales bacterium]|nr:hypothetical protein [Dehalococcoidales bacterium]